MKQARSIRRSVALLAVTATVGAIVLVTATVGNAAAGFKFTRYAGQDRYDTAAQIATDTFGTSDIVIIASGEKFPDALAASYTAGTGGVPILLTQKDTLPSATSTELATLKTTKALIIGGTDAVGTAVEQALVAKNIQTTRVAGTTRYATSQKLAEAAGAGTVGRTGSSSSPTAIVASGETFPDALSAGPAAYAGHFPVVLTAKDALSPEAKAALTDLGIKQVLIVGGTSAVSPATEQSIKDMSIATTRLAGNDRTETATKVADFDLQVLKFTGKTVDLANGANFPDALAGATHGGKSQSPLLLTVDPNTVGAATKGWLSANASTLTSGKIDGGTAAVSDAAATDATNSATAGSTTTTSTTNPLSSLLSTTTTTGGDTTTTTSPLSTLLTTTTTSGGGGTTTTLLNTSTTSGGGGSPTPCPAGQSGPGQPFCFGTADTSGKPTLKSATAATTPTSSITLTYSEAVLCSTVDSNGSDYTVTLNSNNVAVTASCTGSSSTTVTLTPPTLKAGDSGTVTSKAGADGDTVKDVGGTPEDAGESVTYTVPQPGPKMASVAANNNSQSMVITYDQAINCGLNGQGGSVDSNGSDYTITVVTNGSSYTLQQGDIASVACSGSSVTITLIAGEHWVSGQTGEVTAKAGTDGNTVQNSTGTQQEPVGDKQSYTVA